MMEKTSVALVGQLSGKPEDNAWEGPRRQTYYFAKGLGEKSCFEVTVFTERYDETYSYDDEPFEVVPVDLDRWFLPIRLWQNYYFSGQVLKRVLRENYDLVHLHRFYTYPLDKFGTYILTMIGAETRQEVGDIDSYYDYVGDRLNSVLQRRLLTSVDASTAISPRLRDEIREYWNVDVDTVLPLGISEKFFTVKERVIPENDSVLYVSRISRKKNQEYLLEHLDYESLNLRLVGGVHEEAYKESLLEQYPGAGERFVGFVPDEQLLEEYRTARVFVLPSQHENFGFTALEAMASGTPVVIRDTIGLADFLDPNGDDGVIRFSTPKEMEMAVDQLLTDDDRWQQLSENAMATAREMRWPNVVDQYVEFYDEVLEGQ